MRIETAQDTLQTNAARPLAWLLLFAQPLDRVTVHRDYRIERLDRIMDLEAADCRQRAIHEREGHLAIILSRAPRLAIHPQCSIGGYGVSCCIGGYGVLLRPDRGSSARLGCQKVHALGTNSA